MYKKRFFAVLMLLVCILLAQDYHLEMVGNIELPGVVRDVIVSNDIAYVTNDIGVVAVDVSEPSLPQILSSAETPGRAVELFLDEPYLYVADSDLGVAIIDVNMSDSIWYVNSSPPSGKTLDLFVENDYLFTANGDSGVAVYDVSNLDSIAISCPAKQIRLGLSTRSLAFHSSPDSIQYYFYTASSYPNATLGNGHYCCSIVNWGVTQSLHSSTTFEEGIDDIERMSYNHYYMASNNRYIVECNVDFRIRYADLETDFPIIGVYCNGEGFGNRILAAAGYGGIRIFENESPWSVLYQDTPGFAFDTFGNYNYIYVADSSGLVIYEPVPNDVALDYEVLKTPNMNLYNFPNPFNPTTTIRYSLPDNVDEYIIEIFNIKGERVNSFDCDSSGSVIWDGKCNRSNSVASGVYFYQLTSNDKIISRNQMILMK